MRSFARAPEDSIAYLTRALQEGCAREVRAAILFDLGRAARLNTDPAMLEYFGEARQLAEDPVLRGNAAFELATALGLKGEWESAMSLVEDALEELGDRDRELAIRLESYRAAITASDPRLVAGFDRRLPMLHELVERGGRPRVVRWRCYSRPTRCGVRAMRTGASRSSSAAGTTAAFLDAGADLWSLGQGLQALVISERLEQAREVTDAVFANGRRRGLDGPVRAGVRVSRLDRRP